MVFLSLVENLTRNWSDLPKVLRLRMPEFFFDGEKGDHVESDPLAEVVEVVEY
jgi:hypothetical protein